MPPIVEKHKCVNCGWVQAFKDICNYCHGTIFETLKDEFAKTDNVEHPKHYNQGNLEVIDIIKDQLGEKYPGFLKGNILKYLLRYEVKNGVEDLEKAKTYLGWLIEYETGKRA